MSFIIFVVAPFLIAAALLSVLATVDDCDHA